MIKKISFFVKSITVRIIFVMILLVLPLSIWGVLTAAESKRIVLKESKNYISGIGQLVMKELDSRMDLTDLYLFDTLPSNSLFLTVKKQENDSRFLHAVYNVYSEMNTHLSTMQDADIFFLNCQDAGYKYIIARPEYARQRAEAEKVVYKRIDDGAFEKNRKWELLDIDGELWLIRCTHQRSMYYGGLIRIETFYAMLRKSLLYDSLKLSMSSCAEAETAGVIESVCKSDKSDLYLHIQVDESEVVRNLPLFQRIGGLISGIFVCLLPVLIAFIYISLIRPIKILQNAMNEIQKGAWDYQIQNKGNSNEFEQLYSNFNRMVTAQNEMSRELVEKETYAKDMELENLQMQIRPHFLMNSFNLLYGLVAMGKNDSAQQMILYLSDYFRYIVRSGKELELYGEELDLIRNYIGVARLRYPFVSFEEKHDEDVLRAPVPPLLIHNFVENVFKHRLKPKGITKIQLSAAWEDGKAIFQIEDDGRGMSQDIVDAMNTGVFKQEDMKVHVGMKNAYYRIRNFFGEDARLDVKSALREGTTIIIQYRCELEKGKEANNGFTDSGR